ncbi:CHAT domain-containing protein [Moorena producens]|uniref:CHAT domain-containing protein n=1 Tax=Moorena producens TaxID=1155739 RepID=UPI003C72B37A
MKLKQVLWLGLLTVCFTPGELPVVARFLSLPALAQEQNPVSPEQEGTITPRDAIVQVDSKQAEADKLVQQGLSHVDRSEFPEALQSYRQALMIYKQIGYRLGEAKSLTNLGLAYDHLGDYKKAIDYYQKSLVIAREIGNRLGEAKSLGNLGNAYGHLGDYKKALDYHQNSLAIKREIGNPLGEANSLNNLGAIYQSLGDYKKAIDYYQKSLAIKREIGNRVGEANSLNSLGSAYGNLGDYKNAIDYHQNSLAIKREIGNPLGEANSLNNLGGAYGNLGDYKKAIDYYQKSLAIQREIGNPLGEANSLNNIGIAYGHLGDYKKAIDYYQKSLAIKREIGNRLGEANSLGNLGNAYYYMGDYKKAIDYHQQSIAIARVIGHLLVEAKSLNNLSAIFLENNQLEQAQSNLFYAIKVWEDIRKILSNKDDWKVSSFEQQARSYRLLQQVLIAQGQPKQALEISERGRNRALIDLLGAQLSEAPQKTKAPTIEDIQEIAQQQQATLVEYSIVDDQIYSWVIAPTGEITFRSHDLPQDTTLAKLVKFSREEIGVRGRSNHNPSSPQNTKDGNRLQQLYQLLITSIVNLLPHAPSPLNPNNSNRLQELYQLLITPIVDVLPTNPSDRIIFIPHQELFLVPFAALQDDDGNYLIENHTILTAPSIQSLSFTRKHWHRVKDSNGTPLIVGNPTMPTIKIGQEQEPLKSLSGAEKEALTIAQLLKTIALIGAEATEATIVEKMPNASVIHLATHGLVDGIYYRGAIALAPDEPDHDGFLTSREILIGYGLPEKSLLKAKLVVLSACDTGRGEIKGEGVVGLSRSLIAAGVPSLVVSLWQVPDHDTAELMKEFYTNIYTHKMDKAKAMREAMLSMLNDGDGNPDPKAWAAFTVIGEAR